MDGAEGRRKLPKELEQYVCRYLSKREGCAGLSAYEDVFYKVPSEADVTYIAETVQGWKTLLSGLGISFREGEDIEGSRDYRSPQEKRIAVLMLFYKKHGSDATYNKLMVAFFEHRRMDLVSRVVEKAAERLQKEKEEPAAFNESTARPIPLRRRKGKPTVNAIVQLLNGGGFPAARCEDLGMALNIQYSELQNIRSDRRGNVKSQLSSIIDHWLSNDGEASWEKLAGALEQCGYGVLANDIREGKVPHTTQDDASIARDKQSMVTPSKVPAVSPSPVVPPLPVVPPPPVVPPKRSSICPRIDGGKMVYAAVAVFIFIATVVGVYIFLPVAPNPVDPGIVVSPRYPVENKRWLFSALAEVGDWEGLCTHLGVADSTMDDLKHSSKDVKLKKQECLTHYFNNNDPDWGKVIRVVAEYPISNKALACKIADKYMNMCNQKCQSFLKQQKDL